MSVSQLEKAMANLRIGLAEMENKEAQLDAQIAQFRQQLRRVPRQAIYGQASLDTSLAAMGEIEERLTDAEGVKRRLLRIKATAQQELEALTVLKQVDEARTTLSGLRRRGSGRCGNGGGNPPAGGVHRRPRKAGRAGHHRGVPRTGLMAG